MPDEDWRQECDARWPEDRWPMGRDGKRMRPSEAMERFDDPAYQVVEQTMCDNGIEVSTVWLGGIGYNDQWYETMVFGPDRQPLDCYRWHDESEAQAGHTVIVAAVQNMTQQQVEELLAESQDEVEADHEG